MVGPWNNFPEHLGTFVSEDGRLITELDIRIHKAASTANQIKKFIFGKRD